MSVQNWVTWLLCVWVKTIIDRLSRRKHPICHAGVGYRRCFSHSAWNSHCFALLSSAFELKSFPHLRHAILFRWIPFHSMLWVDISLAWHHLSLFPKEKERVSVVYFKWWSAVWKWIGDSWRLDSRTQAVHQKWTTHHGPSATAGELCPHHSRSNRFPNVFQWFSLSQIAGWQCSNGSSLEPLGPEGDYFPWISILPFWFPVDDFIFLLENMIVYFSFSITSSSMSLSSTWHGQVIIYVIPNPVSDSRSSRKQRII
jgi:hypothetical protein